ncbi:MAG: ribonuclease PH [Desulfobulbaceae bacterium DB1]|nr:MAG: ribonuclease PH [Desulfobulbaceae bacterium DB1]
MRIDNRAPDQLRSFSIERNIQPQADASLLIKIGNTHVICAATIENSVPPFLKDKGTGWITAEYGMLPCSTNTRMMREAAKGRSGRTHEIQRLIGRSLRMMLDLSKIGERTIRVDCDVINADGGTRTASITGASLVVRDAIIKLQESGELEEMPDILPMAAVSAGIVAGMPLLDLNYHEDSRAEADANFIMTGDGRWVEAQSTAEGKAFSREDFNRLADLAEKGIKELLGLWQAHQ